MTDALDRIRARVEAHTAAAPPVPPVAPVQPPPDPNAPPTSAGDLSQQVADLNELVAGLSDRVGALEQAAVDDAMSELDTWVDPGAVAALPSVDA